MDNKQTTLYLEKLSRYIAMHVYDGKEVTIEFCTESHFLSLERQTSFIKQYHFLDYHPYGLYNLSFTPYTHSFTMMHAVANYAYIATLITTIYSVVSLRLYI